MDWRPIQTTEITLYLSKAHNWKSPENDQIQNYWLKTFSASHRHIAKNFNSIIEELEKAPDWLTTGITYLITKSGDSKEIRNYRPITCLTTMYKTLTGINLHTFRRTELTTNRARRMSPWKYWLQGSINGIKGNIRGLQEN
jgi:hypothetical protein